MTDAELMELIKSSPQEGLEILMDKYARLAASVVKCRLGDKWTREDGEDCVSETFAEFYRCRNRFDPDKGTLKAFLCAIARHRAAKLYDRLPCLAAEDPAQYEDEIQPQDEVIRIMDRERIAAAIKALGDPDREIIVRKYYFGESSKQIAAKTGLSVSAVDTRAHRALKKLRKELDG